MARSVSGGTGRVHRSRDIIAYRPPYYLRHAALSTWLNAGVAPAQIAEWADHTVDVLLRVYAKCIAGQQKEAKRRILEATQPERDDGKPGPDNQDQGQDERPN